MNPFTRYPLITGAALCAALLSMSMSFAVAQPPEQALDARCGTPQPQADVADDPTRPLDPRDPRLADKLAQRYRQWGRQ
ncbi:MAG: hypothetical protein AB1430_04030 [Pseudomonadota bacterium]